MILIPRELRQRLLQYAASCGIESGQLYITKHGTQMDRSNICRDMKKLSKMARVDESKVFPHNLRHLFARSFYDVDKNLSLLADVLGHSSIETTRIYVATSASQCERVMSKMGLTNI